jgi:hypothetical protein
LTFRANSLLRAQLWTFSPVRKTAGTTPAATRALSGKPRESFDAMCTAEAIDRATCAHAIESGTLVRTLL